MKIPEAGSRDLPFLKSFRFFSSVNTELQLIEKPTSYNQKHNPENIRKNKEFTN
ncbi:hypothetical protein [Christiangramia crocea]|uniref:Uncharacterized protein n=1 Tax=Christiangramia crocea TaxID=2904124 RepID=A0A9X2A538_9FLAO|nr:hypothetical protein [Gramella crocea]MCG9971099.1 hypothetical protein [Gramella crocea]